MVSVRVPESKAQEYRQEINKLVNDKFAKNGEKESVSDSDFEQDDFEITQKEFDPKKFQDLKEFVNKLYKDQEFVNKLRKAQEEKKKD